MSKPFTEWTVLPHSKLVRVDDNIVYANGVVNMPGGDFERRMTVVRLRNGDLVVYSAIALDEAEMSELETFGRMAFLVVPNDIHRMDAKIWKDRYPDVRVVAPEGASEKVAQLVHVDATAIHFGDPDVHFVTVPGTGDREAALVVDSPRGVTLVLNDLIFNVADRPGFRGWLMKTLGMTGDEPHLPGLVKMRQVDDKLALKRQLESWSHLPALKRIIVSHGSIIEAEPANVLEKVAEGLAA